MLRIGRTLPPAAAPLTLLDIAAGFVGGMRGARELRRFTDELQTYFNCRYCFLVSSGKAALTLILLALKQSRPERDRVLIPAFTCYSVPSAVVRAGLKVTLCDIDPATLDFAEEQLREKLADPRLLCVVPVHLFGQPANVAHLRGMISDPEVVVVEDAAQAMGGEVAGVKLGTLGDVGFFSLGRGKSLSTVEGGVIVTSRDDIGKELANQYARMEGYGVIQQVKLLVYATALWLLTRPSLFWLPKAIPFLRLGETIFDPSFPMRKLTGLQAGLARRWQRKLAAYQQGRRALVAQWRAMLPSSGLAITSVGSPPLLRFPVMLDTAQQAQTLVENGNRQGLGIAPTYPAAIHRVPQLADQFSEQEFPAAANAARCLVTLPVHGYVRHRDRMRILSLFQSVQRPEEDGLQSLKVNS